MPAPRALALATSVTYPGTTEHIRIVRADLRAVLHECPMADDVILCVSELAANAVVQSRSRLPGGTFTVRAQNKSRSLCLDRSRGRRWCQESRAR